MKHMGAAASMPATMRTGVLFTEFRAVSRGGDQPKARQLPTEHAVRVAAW